MPLYPLPGGSQNVYAKLLGIPADLVDAAEHLLGLADRWAPRHVDAGRVNGRLFTFSAGAGLDADVVARVDANPARKARWRELAYVQAATAVFLRDYLVRAPRLIVEAPGHDPVEGVTALVQNAPQYTFAGSRPIEVCRDQQLRLRHRLGRDHAPDRPARPARRWAPASGSRGSTSPATATPPPSQASASSRSAEPTAAPVVVQVDGEALEPTPVAQFDVLPGALTVLGR